MDEDEKIITIQDENGQKKEFTIHSKSLSNPKNVLQQWYQMHYKDLSYVTKDFYFTWNDGGLPHEMYHTAVFKCPVTGEVFSCGQFGDKSLYRLKQESVKGLEYFSDDEKVTVVWYRKYLFS